tara:strand:- start:346 stop:1290 length:945 start_codon:yes stop_codon:yes gene_type:complete
MNTDAKLHNNELTARRDRIQSIDFDYLSNPQRTVSECNLCGSDSFLVLSHCDRYGFPVRAHGCRRCGLVFLNPVMTVEAYGAFYKSVYRPLVSAYHGRLIDAHSIQGEQRQYAAERATLLEPYLPDGAERNLLDIGGSTGVVAHAFSKRFDAVSTVVDPAPLEIEEARRLGLETVTGFIEKVNLGDRQFQIVLMCQAIDHLLDIKGALEAIRRLIAADGLFFVDIVDFRAAYLRNWSIEQAVKVDHPFYLTEFTMSAFLTRAGFDIARVEYSEDRLHVGYVCRPATPEPVNLPRPEDVSELWRELRYIQNAPRP